MSIPADPRDLSLSFVEDICIASARKDLGPKASKAAVDARARTLLLFLLGFMPMASTAIH